VEGNHLQIFTKIEDVFWFDQIAGISNLWSTLEKRFLEMMNYFRGVFSFAPAILEWLRVQFG
jgi:hypothetical protein